MNQVLVSLIVDAKIAVKPNIIVKTNNNSELLYFQKICKIFIKANFQIFSGLDKIVKKGINEANEINSAIELIIIIINKRII